MLNVKMECTVLPIELSYLYAFLSLLRTCSACLHKS